MFLQRLVIETPHTILRDIEFHSGLNLIVDDTPTTDTQATGNNVGKTTVLKLVDFCLGAKPSIIYTDTENSKSEYDEVKNFLIDNEVLITLVLADCLEKLSARTIVIERNFLSRKNAIRRINGEDILEKDFGDELMRLIIPNFRGNKPTFKQIISHNIRYKDENINNTLKTLNKYTSDIEYETLYLFLLNCTFDDGEKRQLTLGKIGQEKEYRNRLERKQTKTAYEVALALLEQEIELLNNQKSSLNINEHFERDLADLNRIKYEINKTSSIMSQLNIRKDLILEAQEEMEKNVSTIDLQQLRTLYGEASNNITNLQKTFEDLVQYHNKMLVEKTKFITAELPDLLIEIGDCSNQIKFLLDEEKEMSEIISKSDSFEELEIIIAKITEKYRLKGEYETIVSQVEDVENNISALEEKLKNIDEYLFSSEFEENLKHQINKFNKHFSTISTELYGESYALKYDKAINKKTQQTYYKFSAFNTNMSSGKKQGEILCFDIAYTMFADEENIPCLHFLLNDKKELMHDNQLAKVSEFIKDKNIQLVVSILKDKLPNDLLEQSNIVVELSQDSKLFRIEELNF